MQTAASRGFLKSQGHTVLRFDPADFTRSASRFNPLEEVWLSTGQAISDIQQLATMILDPDGKGLSDYWDKAAFGFFTSVILHCMIVKLSDTGVAASLYDVSLMLEDHKRHTDRQGRMACRLASRTGRTKRTKARVQSTARWPCCKT